jgi:hypothetical protein
MSKLAHSNEATMDEIERKNREMENQDKFDEPPITPKEAIMRTERGGIIEFEDDAERILGYGRGSAMTTKTAKSEMMQAHEAIAAVLDAKIGNMPEWKAFRAVDRALLALEAGQPSGLRVLPLPVRKKRITGTVIPYMTLTDQALTETGRPVTTNKLMEYIGQRRPLSSNDPAKAKIVVQSSLSKDKRFRSVPWDGTRAWWYADKPIPKKETAG